MKKDTKNHAEIRNISGRISSAVLAATVAVFIILSGVPALAQEEPNLPLTEKEIVHPPKEPVIEPEPWIHPQAEGKNLTQNQVTAIWDRFAVGAKLRNIFLYRNDDTFDRAAPYYSPTTQSVGWLGTDFYPKATWFLTADKKIRIYYELEIGINYWNQDNIDTRDTRDSSFFFFRNREIYIEGLLFNDFFGFKVGYQELEDPTQLFIRHYIGSAKLWVNPSWGSIYLMVGMYPQSTADLVSMAQSNFENSVLTGALYGDFPIGKRLKLSGGLYLLHDATVYKKARTIYTPVLSLSAYFGDGDLQGGFIIDAAGQFGVNRKNAYDGSDQQIMAWAAQAHGNLKYKNFALDLNFLDLSPDGTVDHSKTCTAFLYSDWNRSSMILLAQDKDNQWSDNLDARVSVQQGEFYLTRPGYLLIDMKATYAVTKWFTPGIAIGAAWVLQPKNAFGNSFVGNENDLMLNFDLIPGKPGMLTFLIIGQIFVPGKAAAAIVNHINPEDTKNIYTAEAVLQAIF